MKKIFSCLVAFLFLALIVGFSACSNEQDLADENPGAKVVDGDDLIIIAKLGFDPSSVEDMGDYYLVEGDIAIPKENIPGYAKAIAEADTSRLKQAHTTDILTVNNVFEIKVKISEAINSSSNWRTAILNAMEQYNNINSMIRMTEVTSNPDITIYYYSMSAWGEGVFPSNGKPGNILRIQNSDKARSLSLAQKTWLVVHELGHNLGMRHTDWMVSEGQGAYGAIHIPGTPTGASNNPDPNSVFNSGIYYENIIQTWKGFSNYDLIALTYLYPKPIISANNTFACVNEDVVYTLSGNIPSDATITWQDTQNATLISGQGTNTATFKVSGNGYAKVKAVVTKVNSVTIENAGVWVGAPTAPTEIWSQYPDGTLFTTNISSVLLSVVKRPPFSGGYVWEIANGYIQFQSDSTVTIGFHRPEAPASDLLSVEVAAMNRCGVSPYTYAYSGTIEGIKRLEPIKP